jgi:hypothetical protein
MQHELISITKWPTMPAPMHSEDEGEAWVWGDFVGILQKNPKTCSVLMAEMMNQLSKERMASPPLPAVMEYPYAMVVFYRKDRNPHGPSSQPILCVGIEQANYGAFSRLMGDSSLGDGLIPAEGKGNLMVGVFRSDGRSNLGGFDELLSRETARSKFFDVIRTELQPGGEPRYIGEIRVIYGHPETGWPQVGNTKKSSKGGCLSIFLGFAALSYFCYYAGTLVI